MSLWSLLGYALRQSPLVVAGKAARVGRRKVLALVNQGIRSHRSPYPPLRKAPPRGPSLLDAPFRIQVPEAVQAVLLARCREILGHRFDLLGSGWLDAGYPDAPGRERLIARLPPGARAQAAALWALVDPSYRPIDWHADVKSGVRWPEGRWKDGIRYGHMKGVDVKVPWELARLQHLPMLAATLSFAGPELAERMRREIRNQALDFLAANPTGFGVNGVCTMGVAIRAANLCLALDMVRATGGGGAGACDPPFRGGVEAGWMAPGRLLVQNLEWSPDRRGNHYLADLAGLLFVAAWAPPSPETDGWMKLAGDGLVTEIPLQFDGDGANFEASTCYHRLSAEMALYCAALLLGLPEPPALPEPVVARLSRMARFTRDVTKPDGRVVQIGDNDSGRFFKPFPAASPAAPLDEDSLDHRALAGLASALFDDADLTRFAGDGGAAERALAESLSRGR
ncbi:MAG: hypothetical protein HQL34_13140, partial [Alphaproteobacteria bacterium]|nr:hypothetical protein [Alphaproteobacteria bacterium]